MSKPTVSHHHSPVPRESCLATKSGRVYASAPRGVLYRLTDETTVERYPSSVDTSDPVGMSARRSRTVPKPDSYGG